MSDPRLKILVVNGPNLNVLGQREPGTYGTTTLSAIEEDLGVVAGEHGVTVEFFQSNHEGEIVERLQTARGGYDGLIINPAAYTHTSVAIRDALVFSELPAVEVHISNPSAREPFRQKSFVEDVVVARVAGFGPFGYTLALIGLLRHIEERSAR